MKGDALDTLGTTDLSGNETRDAVHIACLPAKAGEWLPPGCHVGVENGIARVGFKNIGIVDPFLKPEHGEVAPRTHIWVMLYPRTITGLRHLWTHPDVPDHGKEVVEEEPKPDEVMFALVNGKSAMDIVLENARMLGVEWRELIERATDYQDTGEYWNEGSRFEGASLTKDFWKAWEAITGRTFKVVEEFNDDGHFFSCAC